MSRQVRKCLACSNLGDKESEYCVLHESASKNLRIGYGLWNRAYGHISPSEYFRRLSSLAETGEKIREMIAFFEKNPEKWE